jgi:hypothetical protein
MSAREKRAYQVLQWWMVLQKGYKTALLKYKTLDKGPMKTKNDR